MRLGPRHLTLSLLVALGGPGAVSAAEAITRVVPPPPGFRATAFRHDVTLREAEKVEGTPTGAAVSLIVRPKPVAPAPQQVATPMPAAAPVVAKLPVIPAIPVIAMPETRIARLTPPAEPLTKSDPIAPLPLPATPPKPAVPAETARKVALPPGGNDLALQPTTFTPYDRYLANVRTVVANLEKQETTMVLAAKLMKQGRGFRYGRRDPYRPDLPEVTQTRRSGDCKSKALWLLDQLGDPDALFVIGKAERRSKTSHAWVYWRHDERWWILDCTDRSEPVAADSVASNRYVAYYSYGTAGTFRHKATHLIMTSKTPSVLEQPTKARSTKTR